MIKNVFLLMFFFSTRLLAQNSNSIWCFGDSAGIDFTNLSNPLPITTTVVSRGSCASISDSVGNLILYCFNKTTINDSSTFIYNYTNDTVQNGNDLYGQGEYNQIIILPVPNETLKYYIIYNGIYSTQGLYYSLVDMNLNSGLGSVIQKNVPLIPNTRMGDCNQAIKHGNGRDWWLIAKLSGPGNTHVNRFFVYLISPGGISSPLIQDFGNATDGDLQKIVFNSKGNKLMNVNVVGLMTEYNFDRCTGILSNPSIIFSEQSSSLTRLFDEGAYSPNDSLFYVSTTWNSFPNDTSRLLQFNLFAPLIPSTCDTLFEIRSPVISGAVRLAPDNKIYYTCFYQWGFPGYPYPDSVYNQYNMNLSVVNNPDNSGVACDFQPFSFNLGGKRTYFGLPNNPNYILGPVIGSSCDTILSVSNSNLVDRLKLSISPNPCSEIIYINGQGLHGRKAIIKITDLLGCVLLLARENVYTNGYLTFTFHLESLTSGIYFVSLETEKEKLVRKIFKQ